MLDEALSINLQSETQLSPIAFSDTRVSTDLVLVRAILAGDEQAFAEIFDRYKRPVTRVVGRFFRDHSEIEEMVQRAFMQAFVSLRKFRGVEENSFGAWMTRIAINVCYDEFRKRKRRSESYLSDLDGEESNFLETIADGRQPSAEQQLSAVQLADKVLGGLDPKDRIAMILVYSEDHSLAEVADLLDVSVSNLKSRLFRCRNQIKGRYGHLFR